MRIILLLGAAMSVAACATVVRGTKETSKFESAPAGATVTAVSISEDQLGPFTCVTPCEIELKRKRTWEITFERDGYQTATGVLRPIVTGGGVASGAGNVIAGGVIGIGVDAGTGANLDLRPNPMVAELKPVGDAERSRIVYKDAEDEAEAKAAEAKARDKAAEKALKSGGAPAPANAAPADATPADAATAGDAAESAADAPVMLEDAPAPSE